VTLPPGPQTGVAAQTLAFHRDPLGFLRGAHGKYGDVFSIRLLTARPLAVVAEPRAVAELLEADPARAHAGEGRKRILPFASARSVFAGDGERHRAAHRRIAPAFAAEAIEPRRPAMAAIAERHARCWPRRRPFRLLPRLRSLADEIFVRLVLGVRDEEIAVALVAAMRRMLWTPGNPPVSLPGPGDGAMGMLGQALYERRQAPVARELARAVEARRQETDEEVDVLGLMTRDAALTTAEIVDELMSLLMAAQEPPSIALSWLLDRLGREPELARRFVADPRGEFADAVVRETLRLTPPASAAIRRLTAPMQAGEWTLPAGITVLVPISLVHRDPRAYRDPDRFDVGRWISGESTGFHLPFGGGARRCIGEGLARAEIEAVAPAVLGQVSLRPLSREPERMVQRATVLAPKRSLLVVAEDIGSA
jgi:cytochrome P450 family 135